MFSFLFVYILTPQTVSCTTLQYVLYRYDFIIYLLLPDATILSDGLVSCHIEHDTSYIVNICSYQMLPQSQTELFRVILTMIRLISLLSQMGILNNIYVGHTVGTISRFLIQIFSYFFIIHCTSHILCVVPFHYSQVQMVFIQKLVDYLNFFLSINPHFSRTFFSF